MRQAPTSHAGACAAPSWRSAFMSPARRRCSRSGRRDRCGGQRAGDPGRAVAGGGGARGAAQRVAPGPVQPQAEEQPAADKPVEEAEIEPVPEPCRRSRTREPPPRATARRAAAAQAKARREEEAEARHANLASAPSPAEQRAERAVAPAPGARLAQSQRGGELEVARWWRRSSATNVTRHEARGEHGVAQLAFSVDRRGGVHHPHVRAPGSSLLDRDALAWLRARNRCRRRRRNPGALIPIAVPLRYNAR